MPTCSRALKRRYQLLLAMVLGAFMSFMVLIAATAKPALADVVVNHTVRGLTVDAQWWSDDDYGGSQYVSVDATNGQVVDLQTGRTSTSSVTVYVSWLDPGGFFGQGEWGYATMDLQRGQLVINPSLKTATLKTTVPVHMYWNGSPWDDPGVKPIEDFTIDLTWTPTGVREPAKGISRTTTGETKLMVRADDTTAYATATGTMSGAGRDFAPTDAFADGRMISANDGILEISR